MKSKYQILSRFYECAHEALDFLSEEGTDTLDFSKDCIMSAISSFNMAFNSYNLRVKPEFVEKEETPF